MRRSFSWPSSAGSVAGAGRRLDTGLEARLLVRFAQLRVVGAQRVALGRERAEVPRLEGVLHVREPGRAQLGVVAEKHRLQAGLVDPGQALGGVDVLPV